MKYPVVIDYGDEKEAHGIYIPDLNVVTAGDTIEKAYEVAKEAADIEMENFVKKGEEIPMPSSLENVMKNPEYKGFAWSSIDINIVPFLEKMVQS